MANYGWVTPPCGPVPALGEQNMSINRQREIAMQALTRQQMADAKVPAPMTRENYGYKPARR